jgi:hypothetical protein
MRFPEYGVGVSLTKWSRRIGSEARLLFCPEEARGFRRGREPMSLPTCWERKVGVYYQEPRFLAASVCRCRSWGACPPNPPEFFALWLSADGRTGHDHRASQRSARALAYRGGKRGLWPGLPLAPKRETPGSGAAPQVPPKAGCRSTAWEDVGNDKGEGGLCFLSPSGPEETQPSPRNPTITGSSDRAKSA